MSELRQYQGPASAASITDADVHKALAFLISIEPEPEDVGSMEEYEAAMERYSADIQSAMQTLRRFAEQIRPQTLEAMQAAYYGFTNDPQYLDRSLTSAVVTSSLNQAWDGVGLWRR